MAIVELEKVIQRERERERGKPEDEPLSFYLQGRNNSREQN